MLKSIDIFPTPVGVRINDSQVHRTAFGGIMSILAIALLLMLSLGTLLPFYQDDNQYQETTVTKELPYKNDLDF